jgi:hypothetical protein
VGDNKVAPDNGVSGVIVGETKGKDEENLGLINAK